MFVRVIFVDRLIFNYISSQVTLICSSFEIYRSIVLSGIERVAVMDNGMILLHVSSRPENILKDVSKVQLFKIIEPK